MTAARLIAITTVFMLAMLETAGANGRPPGTSTINFQRDDQMKIFGGMTFGLVVSNDGGATWSWSCEDAIGYGGTFDPDYVVTSTGVFATTFEGLKVNRDGCSYGASALPGLISTIAMGPDGAIHAAASGPTDGKIHKSIDGGMTFPTSAMAGAPGDWLQSIEVAPSDADVIYVAGYRIGAQTRTQLMFRSGDGGENYQPLPVTDFVTQSVSVIDIVGISRTNPDVVFARVTLAGPGTDAIYRSVDGGQSWTKILEQPAALAFVIRASGELVAGTLAIGSFRSIDNGDTWTPLAAPPHINCLAENAAGEVWACTQNYGGPSIPTDGFGIMKSTDLVTWTGVLRFEDIVAPLACATGTVQKDRCDAELWCGFCAQIGCNANRDCEIPSTDAPVAPGGGCCDAGNSPGGAALLTLLLVVICCWGPTRRRSGTDRVYAPDRQ